MREPTANRGAITVSQLNAYVKRSLQDDPLLRSILLQGEVSGFKVYPSGWYFDLKDEGASVSCVFFQRGRGLTSYQPRNGDRVILHGSASLYEQRGTFQFYVDMIRPDGAGSLWQRFEQLKQRLMEEGLFDRERKRPLPIRPGKIAVVTSASGAVWHDIHKICRERDPGVPLVLVPVGVQGPGAAREIVEGIGKAQRLPGVDLVIVGRGGGSMEDLWCFNEETVARAIAACRVPVISAVGHETDFTIADFVADVRASTPSNAAEMAVPDAAERNSALNLLRRRLAEAVRSGLMERRMTLSALRRQMALCAPGDQLHALQQRCLRLGLDMDRIAGERLRETANQLGMSGLRLERAADAGLEALRQRLEHRRVRLEALDPTRVLERGYALVMAGERPVTRAAEAADRMTLCFVDGEVRVQREEQAHGSEEDREDSKL